MREQSLHSLIHASCFAINADGVPQGVLVRGAAGSGKSSLLLHLIDAGDADFVGDDQIELEACDGVLTARPAKKLAGLLHIHGLGIERRPHLKQAQIVLLIDLVAPSNRQDIPALAPASTTDLLGVCVPSITLCAFDLATPARIKRAVQILPTFGFAGDDGLLGKE